MESVQDAFTVFASSGIAALIDYVLVAFFSYIVDDGAGLWAKFVLIVTIVALYQALAVCMIGYAKMTILLYERGHKCEYLLSLWCSPILLVAICGLYYLGTTHEPHWLFLAIHIITNLGIFIFAPRPVPEQPKMEKGGKGELELEPATNV